MPPALPSGSCTLSSTAWTWGMRAFGSELIVSASALIVGIAPLTAAETSLSMGMFTEPSCRRSESFLPERLWQMGASALSTRSFAEEPSVCTLWISCPTTGRCAATLQSGACTSSLMLVVRSWMMLSEVESPPVSPFLRLSFKTDACAMRTVESDLTFWAERKSRKPDTPQATMSTAMTTATTVPATCRRRGGSGSKRGARPRDWGAALARTTP